MVLSCSLSNGILFVIVFKCFFIMLFFSLYCGITFAPLFLPYLVAFGFSSGFSPPSLPHVSYVENYAVVVVGVNRNRIKGGS